MTEPSITLDMSDGIAWLTMSRPDKRNAIDPDFAQALEELADRCAADPQVRCVVLTGSGRFFSVGGDVATFAAAGDGVSDAVGALARNLHAGVYRLATMEKPLVTAINGPAAGAGLSLAILGDIAIAAASAHFTMAYSAIGFTPDGGASWWLPRLVGMRRAQEMLLTNRRIDAEEAAAIGLVTRTVSDDALSAAALETAAALSKGPTRALGGGRALLRESATTELKKHLESEAASIASMAGFPEGREGIAAFSERRPPIYRRC